MSRENKMIKDENGQEQWISRSIVVVGLLCRFVGDDIQIIVEKRGPAVSATGRWCIPCGYLDYDEDITDAVVRELREETGYVVNRNWVHFVDIESEPKGKKQNVVIRHIVFLDKDSRQIEGFKLDENEVTELKWVTIGHVKEIEFASEIIIDRDKLFEVGKWAFNHKDDIIDLFDKYITRECPSLIFKTIEHHAVQITKG